MFRAALETEYKGATSTPIKLVESTSARPVVIEMTFLVLPLKIRGRKRWKR